MRISSQPHSRKGFLIQDPLTIREMTKSNYLKIRKPFKE